MNINKKTIVISVAVLIIVSLAIFFGLKYLKQANEQKVIQENQNRILQEKATDQQSYQNYEQKLIAVYEKNVNDCAKLDEEDEINECVMGVAVQAQRKDYCDKIVNDNKLKGECLDSIDYLSVSWGNDPNKCGNLLTANLQDACYKEYFIKLNAVSDCDGVSDKNRLTECKDAVNYRQALVFSKPAACLSIIDQNIKSDCEKNIIAVPKDSDVDGLPDDLEISLGTNPFKADTDGDGKSDYDEINKYHTNPLEFDR